MRIYYVEGMNMTVKGDEEHNEFPLFLIIIFVISEMQL